VPAGRGAEPVREASRPGSRLACVGAGRPGTRAIMASETGVQTAGVVVHCRRLARRPGRRGAPRADGGQPVHGAA